MVSTKIMGYKMFEFNKVKVVGITAPVCEDIPDSEGIVSYAARGE